MAPDTDTETTDETAEAVDPQDQIASQLGTVQDNVSEPGTQTTHYPDGSSSSHTLEDAGTPVQAEADDEAVDEDEDPDAGHGDGGAAAGDVDPVAGQGGAKTEDED